MTIKINNADDVWYVAREDATGVVKGSLYQVPFIPGSRLDFGSDMTTSKTQNPGRTAGASRRNNYKVSGGLDMDLQVADCFEIMLESLLANKFDANGKLIGASNQQTFYAEERYINNGVVNRNTYSNCDTTSLTVDAKWSGDNVSAKFQAVGLDSDHGTGASTYTVAPASTLNPFSGKDVVQVQVAGLTSVFYSELSLSVEAKKDTAGALGAAKGVATPQDGPRTIKLTLTGYRSDFQPETVIGDLPLDVSFSATLGGKGYKFELPAARGSIPKNTTDGGSRLFQVDFMAEYDPVTGTDIVVQKLPLAS